MKKVLLAIALMIACCSSAFAQKETGFGGQVELGYGFKLGNTKLNVFQVSLMPGYHFNSYVFAGAGIGFNSYSNNGSVSTFPLFAHATVNFTKGQAFTPFATLKVGYGIGGKTESATISGYSIESKIRGGFYIAPSVGVKYRLNEDNALSLALTYDSMSFKQTVEGGGDRLSATEANSALAIRLGWEF